MVRRNFGGLSAARARGGFTLVELLVVIIIIAILAAIAVPAVMRATATAQNARIKTEIDMLHMAIQQYKNEYGSYPPCADVDAAGDIRLGESISISSAFSHGSLPSFRPQLLDVPGRFSISTQVVSLA
jgi:prepilin-type N-terminal cleavage/methylation domain-containing protein